ncbi:ABC transporter ATP-binding protein [Rubrivirga sp.]|uniref:ABC transporter ATP-binding protein n=1 Tax=Rubrivirga sp. TaxID=1885344 RepID=UPI003B52BFED
MADPVPALVATGVAHTFGETRALDGVSLTVGARERVALLGRNGSGKTTLLRVASTQLRPDAGRVEVAGADVVGQPDVVRRHLGVVFQSPALDPALTAREALRLQAALVRIDRAEVAGRVADALADAGLADRAGDRVGTFSGGMVRRLDLARGLLHRPTLALLDEPTTGLDVLARDAFWAALDRRRADGAQVVATHAMDEAARCDRVVIVDAGRVVADGTPDALTSALGPDALWLDTDDADALAATLRGEGHDARAVVDRVLVVSPSARDLVAPFYARPDVRALSIQPPTLADVFAAVVGGRGGR